MGAAAKKLQKEQAKKQQKKQPPKLSVVEGGKMKKKEKAKHIATRRGRPPNPDKKPVYSTILRLPIPLAERMKKAAKKDGVSANAFIIGLIQVYLET